MTKNLKKTKAEEPIRPKKKRDGALKVVTKHDPEKKKIVDSIRFDIPNVPFGVGPCVYKLFYGDKYLINKGKTLAGSLFYLQNGYAYYVGYEQKEGDERENTMHMKMYKHLQKNPGLPFRLEIILISDNAYEILRAEQIALNAALSDKKCLNTNVEAYIPKYKPIAQSYGWISKKDVASFRRFRSRIG